jgi:hypothetical protein
MVTIFIRHRVKDYHEWRKGYDSHQPTVKEAGGKNATVLQSTTDPHDVTVTIEFPDAEAAQALFSDAATHEKMKSAGVEGTPQVWITEKR